MADKVTTKIKGAAELDRKLRELGPDLARKALRSAVSAGALPIKKQAMSLVPVETGRIRRAIYVKQIREESGPQRQTYFVGVRSGKRYQKKNLDAWYWRFIEFGTARQAAQPFLRPAFDARRGEALDRIKTRLAERIAKFAKGL